MAQGTVKYFNEKRGFGFIAVDDDGADVFVHTSAITDPQLDTLREGQRVEFTIIQGERGPRADNVQTIS